MNIFRQKPTGYKGRQAAREDANLSFSEALEKDITDLRSIVGSKYDEGIRDLLRYYHDNLPGLMSK